MALRLRTWWPDETDRSNLAIIVIASIIFLIVTSGFAVMGRNALPFSQSPLSSWNQAVSCHPILLTVEQVLGNKPNPTQHSPNQGGDYSGGRLLLSGSKPLGTNPSSSTWPFSKRSTNPPCTANGPDGTLATLVEIHNVKVMGISNDECGSVYPGICDVTFNICNNVLASTCSNTYPSTMHKIHVEIDMAWIHAKDAPQTPTAGSLIDLQGFVFWDDAHLGEGWHSYSGWEIHPLTAWRPAVHSASNTQTIGSPAVLGIVDQDRVELNGI